MILTYKKENNLYLDGEIDLEKNQFQGIKLIEGSVELSKILEVSTEYSKYYYIRNSDNKEIEICYGCILVSTEDKKYYIPVINFDIGACLSKMVSEQVAKNEEKLQEITDKFYKDVKKITNVVRKVKLTYPIEYLIWEADDEHFTIEGGLNLEEYNRNKNVWYYHPILEKYNTELEKLKLGGKEYKKSGKIK